jgi:CelD/BcsL family acetyltransferase involved in cellulose biosynthesis
MWCELVTDFSRLEELSTHWTQWMRQDRTASIFQSWEWARAFWKAYGPSPGPSGHPLTGGEGGRLSLCTLVAHGDKGPVGVLPLMKNGHTIEFLAASESDYNDVVCEKGSATAVLQTVLDFLLRSSLDWRHLILEKIPGHSKVYQSIRSLSPELQKHFQLVFRCSSPAIVVEQDRSTLDALIAKEQLARFQKNLRKLGSVSFRHFETREEAREHLSRFFDQHVARWAMANERSRFLQPEARVFYEQLVEEFDPREQLRFGVVELDSKPIAYHFGFQYKGALISYKPAFDVNYWEYCPGDELLRWLLQHVKQCDLSELDFTAGDEPFKYRLANRVRKNYTLYVDRQPGSVANCVRSAVRSMQQVVRQKPALKAALKRRLERMRELEAYSHGLVRRGTFLNNCLEGLQRIRRCLWANEETFLWVSSDVTAANDCGVSIKPATLSDLACLSSEFGCFLSEKDLHRYRHLLDRRDRFFIARTREGETFVVCLSTRSEIEAFTGGADRILKLSEPVLLIVECWKVPEPSIRYVSAEVIRALAAHFAGTEIWMYHAGRDESLKQAIRDAGMELRHHLVRHTILRSPQYTTLESLSKQSGLSMKPVVKGVVGAGS